MNLPNDGSIRLVKRSKNGEYNVYWLANEGWEEDWCRLTTLNQCVAYVIKDNEKYEGLRYRIHPCSER